MKFLLLSIIYVLYVFKGTSWITFVHFVWENTRISHIVPKLTKKKLFCMECSVLHRY